jgi:segregation and condensation protein A
MSEIDEVKLIHTIVIGSDWQEVLTNIVVEQNMDPKNIDIIGLANAFLDYLHTMKKFDFRIPARFILIASILLRMKCDMLLEEEIEKQQKQHSASKIDIERIPVLAPPLTRRPTRKVTLAELISALNKAFAFKELKETKKIRMRRAVEGIIRPAEDIEVKIKKIFDEIMKGKTKFSDLVPKWHRKEIVDVFLPLLYLDQRGKIACEQDEFFKEIYIKIRAV